MVDMAKCIACGKTAFFPEYFGASIFCKTCSSLVKIPSWKERLYNNMDDLSEQKRKVLDIANKSRFSQQSMDILYKFFNSFEEAGFVTSVDGGWGQTLKVYRDYCVINTTETFNRETIDEKYAGVMAYIQPAEPSESFLEKNGAGLVTGLLTGRIIQTGVAVAAKTIMNSVVNSEKGKRISKSNNYSVFPGEYEVWYKNINSIDFVNVGKNNLGFIRFFNRDASLPCVLFSFNHGTNKVNLENIMPDVYRTIHSKIHDGKDESQITTSKDEKTDDNTDIIRKYKALLDDGIITSEEFNKKKRDLLGL
jgi:hypothetical protein